MKIKFLTSLYRITLGLVTEWNLDPDNSRKYFFFFFSKFCFPIDLCINSVKETCFSQKYQKWIYQVLEINSSISFEKKKVTENIIRRRRDTYMALT